jgi:hypothetical protein
LPEIPRNRRVQQLSEIADFDDAFYGNTENQPSKAESVAPISVNPEETLFDHFFEALVVTNGNEDKIGFFPRDQLDQMVNEECVLKELRTVFGGTVDDLIIRQYAQKICSIPPTPDSSKNRWPPFFKRIFVTLVLTETLKAIPKFLDENITDQDLPLVRVRRTGKSSHLFYLARRERPDVPLQCLADWNSATVRTFEEWQWTTLAPFFARGERKNILHYPLQDQVILPFVSTIQKGLDEQDWTNIESSGNQVVKTDIHPEHHNFHHSQVSHPL